ncbi:hypothetical protein B0T17DRAFT_2421 [Bombardia bombarda]|uniref:Uncharacterized protein n=1 Tax=Bombardia bombarda TaxID=252184 RepID=A0AA40CEE1_9PEZI|nr:hypothetical protein B0T17DRAFT_2421 [Bombardia bombarda]
MDHLGLSEDKPAKGAASHTLQRYIQGDDSDGSVTERLLEGVVDISGIMRRLSKVQEELERLTSNIQPSSASPTQTPGGNK